jgi:glycosyltransferase involved in cell wall biosynthesis
LHAVFVSAAGTIGGAERVLLALVHATRLAWPSARVTVLALADGPMVPALRATGAEVRGVFLPTAASQLGESHLRGAGRVRRGLGLLLNLLRTGPTLLAWMRTLRGVLAELRPTFIHANGLKPQLLTAWASPPGVPLFWHLHDFYGLRPLIRPWLRWGRRAELRLLAISRAVAADVRRVVPGVPTQVLYNTVDTTHSCPSGPRADLLGTGVRIGLVATYARWKGHAIFLAALAQVRQLRPTHAFTAYIVGGPIYQTTAQVSVDELRQQAKQCGVADVVQFVPFQADPAPIYRALDIVVHASTLPEPFGLTIVEAMACGRAVIAVSAGGAAELFTPGVDALGVRGAQAPDLAHALVQLLDDPALRTQLGQAAESSVQRFATADLPQRWAAVLSIK